MTLLRGLLFAALAVLIAVLLPRPQAMRLLAMLLASTAAVYVGMALVDGRPSILAAVPVRPDGDHHGSNNQRTAPPT